MANSGNSNSLFRGLQTQVSQLVNNSFEQVNNQNHNTPSNNHQQLPPPQQQQPSHNPHQSLSGHHSNTSALPVSTNNITPLAGRPSGIAASASNNRQIPTTVTTAQSPDHMSTLMAKLWFDHNVESSLYSQKKEEHEKRMTDLRKQLEYISDTNWKYSPIEKFIGQH